MHKRHKIRMTMIASGSTGNAALLQANGINILIDAGISAKRITSGLAAFGLTTENLHGIVITHEHSDHIQGLGVLLKKKTVPVYCRAGVIDGILSKFPHLERNIVDTGEYFGIDDVAVESFSVNHDAVDPVGYNFYSGRLKIGYCTDIGKVTRLVKDKLADCDILTIESNHDVEMLRTGSYPEFLKRRISGNNGHLSNAAAGETLAALKRKDKCVVFLAHLSRENNKAALAEATVSKILTDNDICLKDELQLRMTWPDMLESYEIIA